MELKREPETKFFFDPDHDQKIEFVLDRSGNIVKCYFSNKGAKLEIKRRN